MALRNLFCVWSTIPLLVMAICQATTSFAAPANDTPFAKVLFSDDFSGSTLGKDWGSWKSESVVREGVLVGITPRDADHPSVNSLTLPNLSDLEVALKFKFAGSNRFSLMFRDLSYKGSHAGHICHVSISPTAVVLNDGKTGIFRKDIRDRRQAGEKLDEQTKQTLATRTLRTPVKIDPDTWHTLLIRIQGDHLRAWVDTVPAGDLQAPGIAHPTKSNMNITTVDREVFYDDFSIRIP